MPPSDLRAKQRSVVIQIALGFAGIALVGGAVYALTPTLALPTVGDRLAFAVRCSVFSTLTLLAGIGVVAMTRFTNDDALDPTAATPHGALLVHNRYLENTLQQLVLHLVATFSLAARGGPTELRLVPALTACFVVGRIVFWIGYLQHPLRRGPGFTMTFHPSLWALLYVAARTLYEALR